MEINLVAVEEKHYCTKKKCLILGPKWVNWEESKNDICKGLTSKVDGGHTFGVRPY